MGNSLNLSKVTARLEKIPKEFDGKIAQVGFPAGVAYEGGTSVAYVAAIQEFGAPEVKIPPRPFFRPAIKQNSDEWAKTLARMVPAVGEGQATADDVLQAVGMQASADIQSQIAQVTSPALSPITVLLRKWRKDGRKITGKTVGEAAAEIAKGDAGEDPGGDNKPLNDSGLLIASVRNAVASPGSEFKA